MNVASEGGQDLYAEARSEDLAARRVFRGRILLARDSLVRTKSKRRTNFRHRLKSLCRCRNAGLGQLGLGESR